MRTLCASSNATSISSEWDSLLQFLNILEVLDGSFEFPAVDGLSGLAGVLEADSEVAATASSRFGAFDAACGSVADLARQKSMSVLIPEHEGHVVDVARRRRVKDMFRTILIVDWC